MEGDQRNQTHKVVSWEKGSWEMCTTEPMELEDCCNRVSCRDVTLQTKQGDLLNKMWYLILHTQGSSTVKFLGIGCVDKKTSSENKFFLWQPNHSQSMLLCDWLYPWHLETCCLSNQPKGMARSRSYVFCDPVIPVIIRHSCNSARSRDKQRSYPQREL